MLILNPASQNQNIIHQTISTNYVHFKTKLGNIIHQTTSAHNAHFKPGFPKSEVLSTRLLLAQYTHFKTRSPKMRSIIHQTISAHNANLNPGLKIENIIH
ncbi:hypothetical protein CEXT_805451 [Caerostris extrusa]|uniref:Uncharacterized protein n=1 Tax=Caerostris extrusa TaxID=172846 RepID=A0AAV4RBL5_CAEEX|nr:hypothetical protein CEXT_805451 [Caerostris extrusa]